jgi:hypothetical protein
VESFRAANFDIYLPLWLATYNKHVFGPLFVAGILVALYRWFSQVGVIVLVAAMTA